MNKRIVIAATLSIIIVASLGIYITVYTEPETTTPDADSIVWQTQLDPETSQYIVANGKVFLTSTQGYIYGYNATNGERLWKTHVGGNDYKSIVEADGKLYTTGGGLAVVKIDEETGDTELQYMAAEPNDYSLYQGAPTFTIEDNKMVCNYQNDDRAVFDLQTGELLWSTDSKHGIRVYNTTTSEAGQLYIDGREEGTIKAIDLNNGLTVWSIPGYGGITVAQDRVMLLNYASIESHQEVVSSGGYPKEYDILGLNRSTGQLLWKYTPKYLVFNSILYENSLIFASYDGCYYKLNIEDGTIDWKTQVTDLSPNATYPICECVTVQPFIDENNKRLCWGVGAYKNSNSLENAEFSLRSLSLQDGSEKWISSSADIQRYEAFGKANIGITGNHVFVTKYTWVLCFDSTSGTVSWIIDDIDNMHSTTPLLAGDRVIVVTDQSVTAYT